MNKKTLIVILTLVSLFVIFKFSFPVEKSFNTSLTKEVVLALKNKDAEQLSTFIHQVKGVRFSPYAYVGNEDKTMTVEEIKNFFTDKKKYNWGVYDGSGESIIFTPKEYYQRFIYNVDYLNAPQVSYDKTLGQGNTINNAREFYPGATIIEYHFPGIDPQYQGMDWTSLRLVFQKEGNTWYLVGIIKDNWTI